jgi:hypothetical protein
MERFIAGLNIERFHQKLESETDDTKRRMLVRLLLEEQAKIAAIIERSADTIGIRELGLGQA